MNLLERHIVTSLTSELEMFQVAEDCCRYYILLCCAKPLYPLSTMAVHIAVDETSLLLFVTHGESSIQFIREEEIADILPNFLSHTEQTYALYALYARQLWQRRARPTTIIQRLLCRSIGKVQNKYKPLVIFTDIS